MKLIDKDAVMQVIDEKLSYYKDLESRGLLSKEGDVAFRAVRILKSDINFLEMKEIDLEKEIDNYISNNFFGSQTIGFYANRTKEEPDDQDIALCAKHFFELGLKAQKGEGV